MSKKVVVTLSILALILSAGAVGLWYTVNGKLEKDATAIGGSLKEFGTSTYEARLKAPAAAAAAITALRADVASKSEDIASRDANITGLKKNIADRDASIADLETAKTELTRGLTEAKDTAQKAQTELVSKASKVKELEESIAAQAESTAKKIDELARQMDGEKALLIGDFEKFRAAYAKNYNHAVSKGITPPVGPDPLGAAAGKKSDGLRFASAGYLAEIVAVDTRQGFLVLSIGPESGVAKDQAFDAFLGTQSLGRVNIVSVLNGSVTTAVVAPGGKLDQLAKGVTLRLVPLGIATAPVAAPAAVAGPAAPAAE